MQMNESPATVALDLLDAAYAALLRADFVALPDLTARLERELAQPPVRFGADGLRQIRQRADRNAVVLLAAQRGIRAARRRVEEVRSASSGLVTYDRSGKRAEVSEARSLAQRL
jgi:hypothetical protein